MKISQPREHPRCVLRVKPHTSAGAQKILRSKNVNFRLGGPDPQMGNLCPQWIGALYRAPKGAHCSERTVAISAAVAEIIDLEEKI